MIRDFLAEYYSWFLAAHIIVVMFWMAGMYYLPRLFVYHAEACLLYTSPSPRDLSTSRMPSSA